jgi:hypothetical protein
MLNIFFEGAREIKKPPAMKDEDCASAWALPVDEPKELIVGPNGETETVMCRRWVLAYMPNREDMEAVAAGRPIFLSIMGTQLAPHAVFTLDENGDANE